MATAVAPIVRSHDIDISIGFGNIPKTGKSLTWQRIDHKYDTGVIDMSSTSPDNSQLVFGCRVEFATDKAEKEDRSG